jgi:hypothetical protein
LACRLWTARFAWPHCPRGKAAMRRERHVHAATWTATSRSAFRLINASERWTTTSETRVSSSVRNCWKCSLIAAENHSRGSCRAAGRWLRARTSIDRRSGRLDCAREWPVPWRRERSGSAIVRPRVQCGRSWPRGRRCAPAERNTPRRMDWQAHHEGCSSDRCT